MSARHVLGKVGMALATLAFVLVFNFFLFRAVGDPKKDLYRVPNQTFAQRQQLIHERGLDRSLGRQFVIYVEDTLQGQLETSYYTRRPVLDELWAALPNTLLLVLPATLIATVVGTWLGIIASARRGSRVDAGTTVGSLALWSAPPFWLGMIFVTIFAVQLGAFPTGLKTTPGAGYTGIEYWLDVLRHAILPVLTLALGLLAQWTLIMRSSLNDVLREDYVTTARAIGLPRGGVLRRHAVPNALLPVIALTGINLGFVVSGAITVEALYSWPGIGDLTYQSIIQNDIPMLQGIFLLTSAAVILSNLAADLVLMTLDPRVRAA